VKRQKMNIKLYFEVPLENEGLEIDVVGTD
jgi:hypothetical protein